MLLFFDGFVFLLNCLHIDLNQTLLCYIIAVLSYNLTSVTYDYFHRIRNYTLYFTIVRNFPLNIKK